MRHKKLRISFTIKPVESAEESLSSVEFCVVILALQWLQWRKVEKLHRFPLSVLRDVRKRKLLSALIVSHQSITASRHGGVN